jgi:hypothetical protein
MLLPVFVTVDPARTAKLDAAPSATIGPADAGRLARTAAKATHATARRFCKVMKYPCLKSLSPGSKNYTIITKY